MARGIDDVDLKIIRILKADSTTSKAEIGRRLKLAASAVFERVKKLEKMGVIRGYSVRTDAELLGFPVLAFVFVAEAKPARGPSAGSRLAALPGVEEVHKIAGEDCFLVKVRAKSTKELGSFLDDHVAKIANVRSVRTTIVLKTIAE